MRGQLGPRRSALASWCVLRRVDARIEFCVERRGRPHSHVRNAFGKRGSAIIGSPGALPSAAVASPFDGFPRRCDCGPVEIGDRRSSEW